jgi:hypothetical protein
MILRRAVPLVVIGLLLVASCGVLAQDNGAALEAGQAETDALPSGLETSHRVVSTTCDPLLLVIVLAAGLMLGAGISVGVLAPGLQWTGFGPVWPKQS